MSTLDLLRGTMGLRVADSAGIPVLIASRGLVPRMDAGDLVPKPCDSTLGGDGVIAGPFFDVCEIDPTKIEGIEMYAGPSTIPPQFLSPARIGIAGSF